MWLFVIIIWSRKPLCFLLLPAHLLLREYKVSLLLVFQKKYCCCSEDSEGMRWSVRLQFHLVIIVFDLSSIILSIWTGAFVYTIIRNGINSNRGIICTVGRYANEWKSLYLKQHQINCSYIAWIAIDLDITMLFD